MNTTINTTQFLLNTSFETYNPGCESEIKTIIDSCTNFQLHVFDVYDTRFTIALSLIVIIFLFMLYIKNYEPSFSQTELWKTKIDYRIDLVMICLMFFCLAYIFLM